VGDLELGSRVALPAVFPWCDAERALERLAERERRCVAGARGDLRKRCIARAEQRGGVSEAGARDVPER
jgi:hypothetical protein